MERNELFAELLNWLLINNPARYYELIAEMIPEKLSPKEYMEQIFEEVKSQPSIKECLQQFFKTKKE